MASEIAAGLSVTCVLDRHPANVARARDLARRALSEWHLDAMADVAVLAVSELVTNSLRHGDGPVSVRLSYTGGFLRTEAHDDGASRPVRQSAGTDDESGRGLTLLRDLAGLHGGELGMVEDHDGPGKTVYVTLAAPVSTPVTSHAPVTATAGTEPAADPHWQPASGHPLAALRDELAASGIIATGMTLTRLSASLRLASGFSIGCNCGWLWWRSERLSGTGRPLHAIHPASDPAGAAHRITPLLGPMATHRYAQPVPGGKPTGSRDGDQPRTGSAARRDDAGAREGRRPGAGLMTAFAPGKP